jgi:hypothetical protein
MLMRSVLPCALSGASSEVRADAFSGPSDFAALANSFVIAWISVAVSGFDYLHPAVSEMIAKIAASASANARRLRRADIPRFKKDAITRNILRDAKLK